MSIRSFSLGALLREVQEVQKGEAALASGALPALSALPAAGSGEKYWSPRHPEQQIQRAVLEHHKLHHAPDIFWLHVGNGGYRTPIEAKVLKSLGITAGVPDLILIRGGKTYGLELKAHGGRLSPAQCTAHMLMRAAGAEVEVAIGLDAVLRQLESWACCGGVT
jgi:hypothetical protein